MKVNKRILGLVLTSFGAGVISTVVFSSLGFFMGVLITALGIIELCC